MNQARYELIGGGGGEGYKGGSAGERSQDGYSGGGGGGSGSSWANPTYGTLLEVSGVEKAHVHNNGFARVSFDNGITWVEYDGDLVEDVEIDIPRITLNITFSQATENMSIIHLLLILIEVLQNLHLILRILENFK